MNKEEMTELYVHIYNSGYMAGHHDTVDGYFTDIYDCDMNVYQEDVVLDLVEQLTEERNENSSNTV